MDLIPPSWSSPPANMSAVEGNATENAAAPFLNDGEEQLFQGYSPALLTFASATCIVFILIGIPGNLITIIALARCKRVRNATAVFIINLSLSDLLFCCFNLPLAASTFWRRAWVHGDLLCKLFPLMRYGLLAVSLFTILAITINRYVMIGHPRIYPKIYQRRYLAIMVAATWLCAFCSLIPTWRGAWGTFGLDKSIGSCTILKDRNGNSPKEFLFIMAFVVPCISIVGCYARIFYIVRRTAMRSHEPILVTSSIKMTSSASVKPPKTTHRGKTRHFVEKTPKTSREENSENSSSVSSSTAVPQAPMISIPEIMQGEPDNSPENKFLPDKDQLPVPSGLSRSSERPRPFLSKLRDDELKFIDTSVDSEFPPSLSTLREGTTSKSPDETSAHSFSTARTRTLNGSRTNRNGNNNITHLRVDVDSAVEDSTSSSENNQVFQILGSANPESQFLSVTVEPSSSSGIDIPNDQESPPSRPQHFKKALKSSTQKSSKRSIRKISTMNTSGASLLYPGRMTQKDRRLLKMILVIFLSFLICYLPITITKIAKGATEIHTFNIMGYLLIYLTTCINPIIYVVMSSEYRQAYVNLLMCRSTATTRRNGQFCGTPIGPGNLGMSSRKTEQKSKALKKRQT